MDAKWFGRFMAVNMVLTPMLTLVAMADTGPAGTGEFLTEWGKFGVVAIMGLLLMSSQWAQYKTNDRSTMLHSETAKAVAATAADTARSIASTYSETAKSVAAENCAAAKAFVEAIQQMADKNVAVLMELSQSQKDLTLEWAKRPCNRSAP